MQITPNFLLFRGVALASMILACSTSPHDSQESIAITFTRVHVQEYDVGELKRTTTAAKMTWVNQNLVLLDIVSSTREGQHYTASRLDYRQEDNLLWGDNVVYQTEEMNLISNYMLANLTQGIVDAMGETTIEANGFTIKGRWLTLHLADNSFELQSAEGEGK